MQVLQKNTSDIVLETNKVLKLIKVGECVPRINI